jgi:non-specific serine/threonine protein kinase
MGLQVLAETAVRQRDHVAATALLEEALANWNAVRGLKGAAWTLLDLGRLELADGNDAMAAAHFKESLTTCQEVGDRWGIVLGLEGFVTLAVSAGRAEHAVRLAGAAAAIRESSQVAPSVKQAATLSEDLAVARRLLSRARYSAAWEAGRTISSDEAVVLALGRQDRSSGTRLTSREREVVRLVAQGRTNHQIAEALVIDRRTAEGHVSRILSRLGMRSRAQIAAWAVQNGMGVPAALRSPGSVVA